MERFLIGKNLAAVVVSGTPYIAHDVVSKLAPTQMSEFLALNLGPVQPTVLQTFSEYTSRVKMLERIKSRQDISLYAAFQGFELNPEFSDLQARYFAALKQVEADIKAKMPAYPFADKLVGTSESDYGIDRIHRGGYWISVKLGKKLWGKAAPKWRDFHSGVTDKFSAGRVYIEHNEAYSNGYDAYSNGYDARIDEAGITIGCQRISRYELEQAAVHYGWDFPA